MLLTSLKIVNFRNFDQIELIPAARVNILHGPNGSGKTNILEAIFVLSLGRSQRGAIDSVLVKNGEEFFRIAGTIENENTPSTVAVSYLNRGRKQITIDGVKVRLQELYKRFSVVAVGPEDSEILSGPPSLRRLFMDLYISQYSGNYLDQLSKYNRIVAQKNMALKEQMEFASYNALLIQVGLEIMKSRNQFLKVVQTLSNEYYKHFSNGSELSIAYQPSAVSGGALAETSAEAEFANHLEEISEKEKLLKTALIGPHRDEICISINDLPARTHGSQGEWRSAAIALKLAVFKLLHDRKQNAPLLLMDEVFAELDTRRTEALINSFAGFEQLFLTTATTPPPGLGEMGKSFAIKCGRIEMMA